MPSYLDHSGVYSGGQTALQYQGDQGYQRPMRRNRYNDDEARRALDQSRRAMPIQGQHGTIPPKLSDQAQIVPQNRQQETLKSPVQSQPQSPASPSHGRQVETHAPSSSPAPEIELGVGPTEPIRKSEFKQGNRNVHFAFSPGYGVRNMGPADPLPSINELIGPNGVQHRLYPAPTEVSPPDNIEEGWESTSKVSTMSSLDDSHDSLANGNAQQIAHALQQVDLEPKSPPVLLDVKNRSDDGIINEEIVTPPPPKKSAYIPWVGVKYDNPLPEEEEPTRQELLEVLSHMRRDKGNDGPDTFSNKPDMPNSGGNGFRGSRRDTSGKFEDSPNSRQFGNDEGWTSTNKGDSRGPFGGGGEQNQGGWAGNGDIKDADQGHQNGWDPKKDHPSTVNDLTPPNGDNDGWGDGAKPADNGWNKQPDTKPEPNGWDDSKSIITDTITSNDWNTPLHRPKTQQSSSDTRNQAWSFERGEATVSPGNGATSPAGVHPDRLRMLGGMPRTNDIGPIRNDQPKAIPASPIANSGVDNGWAGRQARTQVVHNNTANQGFGGRGHGGHGGHGGDARGFDPEHQGFGGGDGGRGIGGYNNGPRNVESGQRQPWGSRQDGQADQGTNNWNSPRQGPAPRPLGGADQGGSWGPTTAQPPTNQAIPEGSISHNQAEAGPAEDDQYGGW